MRLLVQHLAIVRRSLRGMVEYLRVMIINVGKVIEGMAAAEV